MSGGPDEDIGRGEAEHADVVARKLARVTEAGAHAKGRVTYQQMAGFCVDEYRLVTRLVALGRGEPMFKDLPRPSSSEVVFADFRLTHPSSSFGPCQARWRSTLPRSLARDRLNGMACTLGVN